MPLCYLYVAMTFSSLIHWFYPRVFRQCFLSNRFDSIDCLLYTTLLCLWDIQYKPWKFVLNGLKCDIPSLVLQRLMRLKRWFDRFVNQWCLISVQEMNFAHWSIIIAKFGPLNCNLKSHFQILTPPEIKCICRLWFSSFCCDIRFQNSGFLYAVRRKIKIANSYFSSEKTDIEYTCNVSFFLFFSFFVQYRSLRQTGSGRTVTIFFCSV